MTTAQARRYPASLAIRCSNESSTPQYERLEDLLRRAGYKETRIFTPERVSVSKDATSPHASLASPSKTRRDVTAGLSRWATELETNDNPHASTSSDKRSRRPTILGHLSSFSNIVQYLSTAGGRASAGVPEQSVSSSQRSTTKPSVPEQTLSSASLPEHQVSNVNVICRPVCNAKGDSILAHGSGCGSPLLLAISETTANSDQRIQPFGSLAWRESCDAEQTNPDELEPEDVMGVQPGQRSISSLRRHLLPAPGFTGGDLETSRSATTGRMGGATQRKRKRRERLPGAWVGG